MTPLHITVDLDRQPWTDVGERGFRYARLERIGLSRNVTTEGKPGVVLLVVDEDGTYLVVSTTYALFRAAARVFAATPVGLAAEEEL